MTVELHNVMKKVRAGAVRVNYEDLNIRLGDKAHVAFLAHSEAGVPSIVDLLCGADAPDKGRIIRNHSISWPIPASVYIQKHISLSANARFLARLYEVDEKDYLARIAETGLAPFMDMRVDKVTGEVKAVFAFAAGVLLPFDRYILTKTMIGKKSFPGLMDRLLTDLRERSGLLLVTSSVKAAAQYCDQAYVFDQGTATFYDDMEAATEHFNSIQSKDKDREAGEEEDDEEDDSDLQNMMALDF
jgi:capsular polysaccharide transport system ATP-binding protein